MGLTILELEELCSLNNIDLTSYEENLHNFRNSIYKLPLVIVLNKKNYNHYFVVTYKNKKGVKVNDLNNNSVFYTYMDLEKHSFSIVMELEKEDQKIFKSFVVENAFSRNNVIKNLLSSWKTIGFIFIFMFLYLATGIGSFFYLLFLFNSETSADIEALVIILFFLTLLIFRFVFKYLYDYCLRILKKNIRQNFFKSYFYDLFFNKKNEHITKTDEQLQKAVDRFNFLINYYVSSWINVVFFLITFIAAIVILIVFHIYFFILILLGFLFLYAFISYLLTYITDSNKKHIDEQNMTFWNKLAALNNSKSIKDSKQKFKELVTLNHNHTNWFSSYLDKVTILKIILENIFLLFIFLTITVLYFLTNQSISHYLIVILVLQYTYFAFVDLSKTSYQYFYLKKTLNNNKKI